MSIFIVPQCFNQYYDLQHEVEDSVFILFNQFILILLIFM